MSFLMTKVGLNVFFSIDQSVSHHNIMVLLPYVSQLSNITSQLKDIYGLHVGSLTSCFGLMADSAVVDSALVDAALRKSGLI
jgi:hypothetical protein